jgi:DNA-binding CsgD family transcriptional regulator
MWQKMPKYIILFIWLLTAINVNAQVSTGPFEDRLMNLYEQGKYQVVIELIDSMLIHDPSENLARIHQIKADALYFLNNVDASLQNYLKAVDLLEHYKLDSTYMIALFNHVGFCLKYEGKYKDALPYYNQALILAKLRNDSSGMANGLFNLGLLNAEIDNYTKAAHFLDSAFNLDFARMDTAAFGYDLTSLGDLMMKVEDYEMAIHYYKQGVAVKETIGGDHSIGILRQGKLSHAFLKAGNLDSASYYNIIAISGAMANSDSLTWVKQLLVRGEIEIERSEFELALETGRYCTYFFADLGDNRFLSQAMKITTDALVGMNRHHEALAVLTQLESIIKMDHWIDESVYIAKMKSEILELLGRSDEAIYYTKRLLELQESLLEREKQKNVYRLNQEYLSKQKEQEIALLKAREDLMEIQLLKKRRESIALTALILFVFVGGGFVFYSIRRKNKLEQALLASQVTELRYKLKAILEFKPEEVGISQDQINEMLEDPLSDREFEILNLALSNKSNTEIASTVSLSVNTVKFHLKNVFRKLGVNNRKEAFEYVAKNA